MEPGGIVLVVLMVVLVVAIIVSGRKNKGQGKESE